MPEGEPGADARRAAQVVEEESLGSSFDATSPQPDESYRGGGFFWKISSDVEHVVVRALQMYFRDHPLTSKFRWVFPLPDGQKNPASMIHITEVFAEPSERAYPAVIPIVTPAGAIPFGFGDDAGTYDYVDERGESHQYVRKSGMFSLVVTLQCFALNPMQCKELADIVGLGLVYPLKEEIRKREVEVKPASSVTVGELRQENLTPLGGQIQYNISITFGVVTTWYQDFEVLGPTIKDVTVGTLQKTGPPALDP